eukprot:g54282.t1
MLVPMSLSTQWVRAPDQKDRSSIQKGSSSIPRTPLISPSSTFTQDVEFMGESREGKDKSVAAPPLAEVEAGYQGGEYDEQGNIAWYYDDKKKSKVVVGGNGEIPRHDELKRSYRTSDARKYHSLIPEHFPIGDPATMEDRPSPIEVVIPKVDAPTGTDLLPHHSSSPAQGNEQSGRKADEDVSEDEGEKSPRPITYSPNYAFMPDLIPPSPVIETRDRDRDEEKEKHRSGKDVMKRGRKPKERVVLLRGDCCRYWVYLRRAKSVIGEIQVDSFFCSPFLCSSPRLSPSSPPRTYPRLSLRPSVSMHFAAYLEWIRVLVRGIRLIEVLTQRCKLRQSSNKEAPELRIKSVTMPASRDRRDRDPCRGKQQEESGKPSYFSKNFSCLHYLNSPLVTDMTHR